MSLVIVVYGSVRGSVRLCARLCAAVRAAVSVRQCLAVSGKVVCAHCAQYARQCTAVCLVVYGSAEVRVWQCGRVRQCGRLRAALNNK